MCLFLWMKIMRLDMLPPNSLICGIVPPPSGASGNAPSGGKGDQEARKTTDKSHGTFARRKQGDVFYRNRGGKKTRRLERQLTSPMGPSQEENKETISSRKMEIPIRTQNCEHMQSFGLESKNLVRVATIDTILT